MSIGPLYDAGYAQGYRDAFVKLKPLITEALAMAKATDALVEELMLQSPPPPAGASPPSPSAQG